MNIAPLIWAAFKPFLIFAAILVLILVIVKTLKNKNNLEDEKYPYKKKEKLFTNNELRFYTELKRIVGEQYTIFGQVRMEDIINVKKGIEKKKAYGFRGRIKSRHIDFILCNPDDCSIVAAIELDDKSHNSTKAIKNDVFKDKAFKDAGLPLIRFNTKKSYSKDIKEKLLDGIGFNNEQMVLQLDKRKRVEVKKESNQNKKLCPKCSSTMIQKKASKGKFAGKSFLACSEYPACKTILPLKTA